MNTVTTWQTESTSSAQTEQLAETLGRNLRGGETIELVSDLGGGKTTFTRGLVRGTGSRDKVASPTFTLSREYTAPKFTLYHFDFYRLNEAGIMADELAEVVRDDKDVTIIEWGDIVQDVLAGDKLTVKFSRLHNGEEYRAIIITYPKNYSYLLEGVS